MIDFLEELVKSYQLKIMQKPKGMERIEEGGLYFLPFDVRVKVLKEYNKKIKKLAK